MPWGSRAKAASISLQACASFAAALASVHGEVDVGAGDAGPVELWEVPGLRGVGVGHGQGVAAAAVEGVLEVEDLVAALVDGRRPGSSGASSRRRPSWRSPPPARRRRRRTGSGTRRARRAGGRSPRRPRTGACRCRSWRGWRWPPGERGHELGVARQARVVVPDGQRGEVAVAVQDLAAVDGVHDPRAVGVLEVDDDVEPVGQDVASHGVMDAARCDVGCWHVDLRRVDVGGRSRPGRPAARRLQHPFRRPEEKRPIVARQAPHGHAADSVDPPHSTPRR